jgi:hypothetical protein
VRPKSLLKNAFVAFFNPRQVRSTARKTGDLIAGFGIASMRWRSPLNIQQVARDEEVFAKSARISSEFGGRTGLPILPSQTSSLPDGCGAINITGMAKQRNFCPQRLGKRLRPHD